MTLPQSELLSFSMHIKTNRHLRQINYFFLVIFVIDLQWLNISLQRINIDFKPSWRYINEFITRYQLASLPLEQLYKTRKHKTVDAEKLLCWVCHCIYSKRFDAFSLQTCTWMWSEYANTDWRWQTFTLNPNNRMEFSQFTWLHFAHVEVCLETWAASRLSSLPPVWRTQ